MSNVDSAAVVDRLRAVYGAKDDSELSKAMDQKRSTVGNWRNRGTIPYTECVKVAGDKSISLDWLLTGEGPMRRDEAGATALQEAPGGYAADPREQALLALWRELDEGAQREIQHAAQDKKRLSAIENQLQELQAAVASLIRSA
ncbi:MAG: helix-turn-helix domain containing protein [Pseudomonadaceae bacterium]|nr:helix-turn-helix domain containing protein [Pseudomonadaceae bacterium]